MARAQATVTTDHDEIRRWAEERGATPACVRGTGGDGDIGMLRLDFPGYGGENSLQPITWDEWFRKFDERGLALLHQDQTARGVKSNFNKLIARETAERRSEGDRKFRRRHPERGRSARASAGRSGARRGTAKTSRRRSAKRPAMTGKRRTAQARTTAKGRRRTSGGRAAKKHPTGRSASTRRRTSPSAVRGSRGRVSRGARVLTDRDEIRRWAEERGAAPACVRGTGGGRDVGMIRLDFPGFSGQRSLEHIDWDEWFKAFEDSKLALLAQDTTARGQKSNFNKLVGRETAQARQRGVSGASRRHPERASKSSRGRKSTSASSKSNRGSTRAKRPQSVRGRTIARRKAA